MAEKTQKARILRCPTCNTVVQTTDDDAPFCSDRCRVVDLGKWASGGYRISSPVLDPEVLENLGALRNQERYSPDTEND